MTLSPGTKLGSFEVSGLIGVGGMGEVYRATDSKLGREVAMEMLLTGKMVGAEEARAMGLVNRVVEPDALERATSELAASVAEKSPYVLAIGKEAFYRPLELGLEEAYRYAGGVMTENMMARDAHEGIGAFLEKRKPVWQGC